MIAQFAIRLVCGMGIMWSLMPRSRVTSGFFRIQMLVALGLSVLAALSFGELAAEPPEGAPLLSAGASQWLCAAMAVGAFLGSVMWTLERRQAGTVFVFLITAISSLVLLLSVTSGPALQSVVGSVHLLSELSAAALLGGAMTGMLLGHWYLTAPTMSIAPLSRLTAYFGGAAVLRLIVSSVGLWLAWGQLGSQTHWIWLSMRWFAGVLGPLIVFLMTWRILKYKNTQAATGVLFVGVILTFIGEMTAALLYQELLMPF